MLKSSIVKKSDFDTQNFKRLTSELHESWRYHRKLWEFVKIAETLEILNKLKPDNCGLGFGVGTEPLPAYFASKGCSILATDQPSTNTNAANWTGSNQYCNELNDLNKTNICETTIFNKLVNFRPVDMNWIPIDLPKFDFIWSACALEHLGTLQHGLWFILRTLSLLKPGGVAVHTTEFNLSSNDATNDYHANNIYRQKDIQTLNRTVTDLGFSMYTDFTRETHEYDTYVDRGTCPGFNDGYSKPHLNLQIDSFDATSIILIISKPVNDQRL